MNDEIQIESTLQSKIKLDDNYFNENGILLLYLDKVVSWLQEDIGRTFTIDFKSQEKADEAWDKADIVFDMALEKHENESRETDENGSSEPALEEAKLGNLLNIAEKISNPVFVMNRRAKLIEELLNDKVSL